MTDNDRDDRISLLVKLSMVETDIPTFACNCRSGSHLQPFVDIDMDEIKVQILHSHYPD
jgi:hypothetical protein